MNSVSVAAAASSASTTDTSSGAGKLQQQLPARKLASSPLTYGSEQQPTASSEKVVVVSGAVASDGDVHRPTTTTTTTPVVIIKAEPCEDSTSPPPSQQLGTTGGIQNGGTMKGTMQGIAAENNNQAKTENGPVESTEAAAAGVGVAAQPKAAINGTTNQNRMIRTTSAKSKHLTRSHAMRESASPPRTPAAARECNGQAASPDSQEVSASTTVIAEPSPVPAGPTLAEVLTPPKIYPVAAVDGNGKSTSQLDLDFPKLNAPKPKSPRNNMDKSQSSDSSKSVNSLDAHSPTATLNRKDGGLNRNLSPSSQHSNKELSALDHDNSPLLSPGSYDNRSSGREHSKSPSGENRGPGYHGNSGGKKHKGASGAKSNNANKSRLKAQGSSSSVEGNNNSTVFISKDNSFEQFTDQSGVDLIKFFRETLNKNTKDRSMLLKIEKELHDLATDRTRHQVKFPSMSSYNRMLIHRCAAYFGMDHNVDSTQTSVIVAVTKSTRIPEILFDTLIRESLDEPRKSILKRDAHSFDECRQSLLPNPDRGLLDRKAKSFEEREEDYEKVRRRIFKGRELIGGGYRGMELQDENSWPWSSTESSDNSGKIKAQNNRLLKVQSLSVDTRHDRPSVSKSHSFGGYGGPSSGGGGGGVGNHHSHHLNRGDSITSTKSAGPRFFTKQDSMGGTPWRLSPSSSGYKTQTQSLRSDSITPSPTGYGSGGDHTPEPQTSSSTGGSGNRSVVWAVTDMASVPRGSVLIDPQTLQPIVNQDGSIYYFDPSNVPPIAMKMTHHGHMNRHYPPPFMMPGMGGGGMGGGNGGGGGGGHASGRRRTERKPGPGEEMGSTMGGGGQKEQQQLQKGSNSNTGSIDVIPEDQFQGNCTPTEVNVVSANCGSAVPSEEGSHYTKGESSSSPEHLEDTISDNKREAVETEEDEEVEEVEAEGAEEKDDSLADNVERIFVPEHKNQATSPGHPMAQPSEEYVVVAATTGASDTELASSSQCLTPPPPPSQLSRPIQSVTNASECDAVELPTSSSSSLLPLPLTETATVTAMPNVIPTELTTAEENLLPQTEADETTILAKEEEIPEEEEVVDVEGGVGVEPETGETVAATLSLNVVTNASSTTTTTIPDSHAMTISTTCTSSSSSSTHSTAVNSTTVVSDTNPAERKEDSQNGVGSGGGGGGSTTTATTSTISSSNTNATVANYRTVYKPFNRNHANNNSQGDPRSSSTTIASPLNTSTSYQVHAVGQPQYVAHHPQARPEDQMHAYQPTGITYSTTIDANGNTYTGATNMPYAATYQQMPDSGGYMVYAAPYPMEAVGEMPGYYVPVYDQAGNATLVPATSGREPQQTTILQAAPPPPPGAHVYQPNTTTLIPALPAGSQLVYAPAPDGQFGAANMQQPQQFTAVPAGSYPPGTAVTYAPYGATAYNAPSTYHTNFWGQPMTTYYVSSPPAQSMQQTAVPIQIPMPMQQQPQQQSGKGTGTHSNPPTPQATTFAGNPFNAGNPGGHMQMSISAGNMEAMPPPVYAISTTGMPMQMTGGHQGQNKYQNVYPYSTNVVPMPPVVASATPPATIYQQAPPYQSQVVHGGGGGQGKPMTNNSPPQAGGSSTADLQTNPSSTTSTPLQKSPPSQIPDTSVSSGYEKKTRRGPPNEVTGAPTTQYSGPPRTHGYMGNGYARNPNQTYTPRGYAPKKHYSTETGPSGMGQHNKTIVLNAPMQQASGSPGIYSHYHPSAGGQTHQAPTQQQPGIRGPRPKPANLDLRRTGSHYQPPNGPSGGNTTGTGGGGGGGNSQRNTPSTNSTESNNSPNSVTGGGAVTAGGGMTDHNRNSGQMGYYPAHSAATGGVPHHPGGHPLVMHQPLMGSPANPVGPGGHPGMYVKLGQTYFPHPTLATPMGGNRRSPPNEIRPQFNPHHSLTTGLYPMNMQQLSGPRHGAGGPRHGHHNSYKGSR